MEDLLKISETEFVEIYKPMPSPGDPDHLLWTFQEVKAAGWPLNQVWTIVETGDADDENWYAVPGYHLVNRIDYVVTEKPWPHENIEAVYFEDDFEKDEA